MNKARLVFLFLILTSGLAAAHGTALTMAQPKDLLMLYPNGAKLEPAKMPVAKNNPYKEGAGVMKWMKVVSENGGEVGLVGMEKVSTHHGHLVQASCFDAKGKLMSVRVMRVMEDEAASIKKKTSAKDWWLNFTVPEKGTDAWSALLRSVARTKAALEAARRK